jgi:uncharacterized protein (TIGR02246 family)
MMTPLEVAEAFVAAINAGDADRLADLMTQDHTFIDADGSEHAGRDQMHSGWREHFEMVPDLKIEVLERFSTDDTVVLLGRAEGTIALDSQLKPENHWSVPAAWRVVVRGERVAVWQLFANQHSMHEILKRINEA